ncbi:T9SS type A sorting domain-containing protein [Mucilaginibacter sp. L3T2-6]|uniref:T9SS type A sorting domain-containing protein n=1 Tax=Mucilaginibacter sp. L3T2-6 TaxID=3062491 RepID=UPI002675D3A9|nr:T9SS type A sorting domain-containing protein [Mucilaginibacter sp. L3T2-6]MDO3643933.1 T9SS type A sorting domain-containing protein [Mucilaginibacter sp. L3T2-6]MDV6216344.1 T9SS type A sorting domain-containing protein [Mucilaginibacter sp. L3T2-6]
MKTHIQKPGFEFIFAFALVMILGLPPILLAQIKTQKDVDIRIENGDTTINGKNLRDLTGAERESALNDIKVITGNQNDHMRHKFLFKRIDTGMVDYKSFYGRGEGPMMTWRKDTLGLKRPDKMGGRKRMTFSYRFDDERPDEMSMRERAFDRMPMRKHGRRNTQNFDFENTNGDGVVTHVSFHVSDISDDDLKRMPYVEGPKFEITDFSIVPQFSSGKILLMFNLPSKAPFEVTLSDSQGKALWSEKAAKNTFSKSFPLGLNGIYYLKVKQGKNIAMKKIMKEE